MEAWMSLVGEYGFPIVVTLYLLHRIDKKLDQLNQSVMYLGKLVQFGSQLSQTSPPTLDEPGFDSPLAKEHKVIGKV